MQLMQVTEIPSFLFRKKKKKKQFKIYFKRIKLDKFPVQSWFLIMMLNNDSFLSL